MTSTNTISLPASLVEELFETEDVVGQEPDNSGEQWAFVTTVQGEQGRWRQQMTMIIRRAHDGALFAVDYAEGLTEQCDHYFPWKPDWGGTPEVVSAYEVEAVEKVITVYKKRVVSVDTTQDSP